MKKLNTAPLSGTQEFLPQTQATFDRLKSQISDTFRRHGYFRIKTPSLDRLDILLAKAGGDTEKQIYKVAKTSEDPARSDQGLRFDHTVPLARYVVEHENDLTFPFKVYQIGTNWRGERAQKGRFREFYQCDVDIIGRGQLDLAYDADIIATLLDAYQNLQISTPVQARISNRKILTGFLAALGITDKSDVIYHIIDHADKMPAGAVEDALVELGLPGSTVTAILALIHIQGPREEAIVALEALAIDDLTFRTGVSELAQTLELLAAAGHADAAIADLQIVRGLDYYTGTVFEFCLPEHREVGSIGGGGRYENLASYFTDQKLPGVGGSIGLSRLFYLLNEHKLLGATPVNLLDYAIIPLSSAEIPFSLQTAEKLRADGSSVTLVHLPDKKLSHRLAYAAKIAQRAIVIGEQEVATGNYQIKEFS